METQPLLSSKSHHITRPKNILQDDRDFSTGRYSVLDHPSSQSQEVPREADEDEDGDRSKEYCLTNAKATMVVAALTLTCFLVMLDMSILPTVGNGLLNVLCYVLTKERPRQSRRSHRSFIP